MIEIGTVAVMLRLYGKKFEEISVKGSAHSFTREQRVGLLPEPRRLRTKHLTTEESYKLGTLETALDEAEGKRVTAARAEDGALSVFELDNWDLSHGESQARGPLVMIPENHERSRGI